MCSKNELDEILSIVAEKAKEIFGDKLSVVILFGSYARGDNDDESDIDIMMLADVPAEQLPDYRHQIDSLCGMLLYDYGILVSVTERDTETFNKYCRILPFYQNIQKEGIRIA